MQNAGTLMLWKILCLFLKKCSFYEPESVVNKHVFQQFDLFSNNEEQEALKRKELEDEKEEKKVQEVLLNIKSRFGKNAILKGMNLEEGGTTIERNGQVGGHKG